jgi:hypothetical protein
MYIELETSWYRVESEGKQRLYGVVEAVIDENREVLEHVEWVLADDGSRVGSFIAMLELDFWLVFLVLVHLWELYLVDLPCLGLLLVFL